MFTPPSVRAASSEGVIREQRLDDVLHHLELRGAPAASELGRRIDAALASGVRWLMIDLERATAVPDSVLVATARDLRMRRGELILVSPPAVVVEQLARHARADRPAVAANVDQALMILKMLRPKTEIRRPRKRITSLTLPRIEPPATA
jgi:putative ribosome biogenesis GTPase RsgA